MKHATITETTFIGDANLGLTAKPRGRPIHKMLVSAGLIMAGLAAVAYVIDLAGGRQIDTPAWPRVVGYALAVLLSLMNAFVHSRDGYTAVVPTGLMLSGLVIVVLLLTAWVGMALVNRPRVGG